MKNKILVITALILFSFLIINKVSANTFYVDFESGAAFSGYNNIRIPGDTGTKFSAKDDLNTKTAPFYRLRVGYIINKKHDISALFSVLNLEAEGSVNKNIDFNGVTFPANNNLDLNYRFNNYRFTYRYNFFTKDNFKFGAGLTLFVRDAAISLKDSTNKSVKSNVGFVPLINLKLEWNFVKWMGIYLEADFLFSTKGRAEDATFALQFFPHERIGIRIGYRLLEGGADNDSVYNFTLVHFATFGITFKL